MTDQLFPYANIVVGILVLVVGFIFHWVGQLISVINWDLASKLGLQEKKIIPEFKVYEKGTAMADVAIGWVYGVAAIGVLADVDWAYKLLWIPGVVLTYHGLCFWFWTGNQNKSGNPMNGLVFQIAWSLSNLIIGILAILVAFNS